MWKKLIKFINFIKDKSLEMIYPKVRLRFIWDYTDYCNYLQYSVKGKEWVYIKYWTLDLEGTLKSMSSYRKKFIFSEFSIEDAYEEYGSEEKLGRYIKREFYDKVKIIQEL